MRDVSTKNFTLRTATARAVLTAAPATLALLRAGQIPKGDPLPVAQVAAIQAAKLTPQLIRQLYGMQADEILHGIDVPQPAAMPAPVRWAATAVAQAA